MPPGSERRRRPASPAPRRDRTAGRRSGVDRRCSERRPGNRRPVAGRLRVAALGQQPVDPAAHRGHLAPGQQRRQRVVQRPPPAARGTRDSTSTASSGSGSPAHATARCAACPAGGTRRRGPPRTRARRPSGCRCPPFRSALLTIASNSTIRRSGGRSSRISRRQVDGVVAVHPELDHALAERPVPQHGRRHHVPAQRLRDHVRRDLPLGQRAVREVPQRPLAPHRLVDAAGA